MAVAMPACLSVNQVSAECQPGCTNPAMPSARLC